MSKEPKKFATVEAAKIALISTVTVAVIGLMTAGINAYANYMSNRTQIELPIIYTQTAEARLTAIAPTSTFLVTDTPVYVYTTTPTETLTATGTPTVTPTPSFSVIFPKIPRSEPILEKDFLFYDVFDSDNNDWFYKVTHLDALVALENNTLEVSLGNSFTPSFFLSGCSTEECRINKPAEQNISYKFGLQRIHATPNILAGIAFGSETTLVNPNNLYILLASNEGQIRFYSISSNNEFNEFYNEINAISQIPINGEINVQIDFYKNGCRNTLKPCANIFTNGNLITQEPLEITDTLLDGYFGIYVFSGNSQGFNRVINYNYIKVWSTP